MLNINMLKVCSIITIFSLFFGLQSVCAEVEPPHQQEPITVALNAEAYDFELEDALEINPYDAESHALLGRIYYEKDMITLTIYEFSRASEIDPRYTEIYAKLISVFGKEKIDVKSPLTPLCQKGEGGGFCTQTAPSDSLSKVAEAMDANAPCNNSRKEVNLDNILSQAETSMAYSDRKRAKLTFNSKYFILLKNAIGRVKKELFVSEEQKDAARLPLFIINVLMFATVGLVAYTVFNLLPAEANPTKSRLEQLRFAASAQNRKKSLSQARRKEAHFLKERLYALGQLIIPRGEAARSKMKMELARAGYRRADAVSIYSGVKVLLALIFMGSFIVAGFIMKMKPGLVVFLSPAIAGLGMYLPILFLRYKTKKRKTTIMAGFPDALDLLAVCVDAGLGLDAAIVKVADEIRLANKELSEEFQLLNLEIRAGKPRSEALHNLGLRTDVDDIQSLVAMLIQADKFGTSIAQSLRVHSDAARSKRKLKAEEAAAKTTVKMVFPLLLFILPALFVIVMAPAVLQIIRNMGSK